MTTDKFTKEQLIAKAREQITFCRHTKITGEGGAHVNQCSALFEIALVALEAEAVADFDKWFEDVIRPAMQINGIRLAEQKMAYGTAMMSWEACRIVMLQGAVNAELRPGNSPVIPDCWCQTCRPVKLNDMRFVVCPECGNKRCPHANDHRNACTGSNEPGQEGSAYPAAPVVVKFPTEFYSEKGIVVQLEKVMAALAVRGIGYERKESRSGSTPSMLAALKDNEIRDLINELRDIAVEYHGTQQLRERIARTVRAAMNQGGKS
ncbi:hypothetical protein [Enterobacter soli]|uniref:hypothetical protein n=1 Tax=Enterobacter soli TaxID=885040 RepID=UPI002F3FA81C